MYVASDGFLLLCMFQGRSARRAGATVGMSGTELPAAVSASGLVAAV